MSRSVNTKSRSKSRQHDSVISADRERPIKPSGTGNSQGLEVGWAQTVWGRKSYMQRDPEAEPGVGLGKI